MKLNMQWLKIQLGSWISSKKLNMQWLKIQLGSWISSKKLNMQWLKTQFGSWISSKKSVLQNMFVCRIYLRSMIWSKVFIIVVIANERYMQKGNIIVILCMHVSFRLSDKRRNYFAQKAEAQKRLFRTTNRGTGGEMSEFDKKRQSIEKRKEELVCREQIYLKFNCNLLPIYLDRLSPLVKVASAS